MCHIFLLLFINLINSLGIQIYSLIIENKSIPMICDPHGESEMSEPTKVYGKSVILNSDRWNSILKHLDHGKDVSVQDEETRRYNEYLRNESRAMTKNWENSLEKIRERKNIEKARLENEKILEGKTKLSTQFLILKYILFFVNLR